MDNSISLLKSLEDTQASLATALARIEAYRIREKYLLQENYRLRQALKQTEGETLKTALSKTMSKQFQRIDTSTLREEDNAVKESQTTTGGINYRLHEEYPIILHTKKGKVPASLSASPDVIEVFESKARIGAAQFVGMTNLSEEKARGQSPKLATKSWTSYLFGKSKTTEDLVSPRAAVKKVQEARSATSSPTGPPVLTHFSWDGKTQRSPSKPDREENSADSSSVWQVLWKDGGGGSKLKQIVFEASVAAQGFINRTIEAWSEVASRAASIEDSTQGTVEEQNEGPVDELEPITSLADEGVIVPPKHLLATGPQAVLTSPSELLDEELVRCITTALPNRFRMSTWDLLYSTDKHGFSLQSLYRKAAGISPTVLLIKDGADFIFGAYCSEAWKMGSRFYGTGETFVFQLEPHRVYYPWKQDSSVRNNFFMFGSAECLGVGGTGHFSIWLDSELLYGHSGLCDTFGSPCLASKEEFKILKLELWGLK